MTRTKKAVVTKSDKPESGVTEKRARASSDAHQKRPVGRPPTFDRQAVAELVFSGMAEGKSLRACFRETEGLPTLGTFLVWVSEDSLLAEQYARARSVCLDAMAEDIIDLADTCRIGQKSTSKATGLESTEGDMVERSRLQIDARKWLLSKLAPKKYGDKQQVEHSGTIGLESLVAGGNGEA